MNITPEWAAAIDAYLVARRAAADRDTTIRSTRERLQHLARRSPADPWTMTKDELLEFVGAQEWKLETRRGRYNVYRGFFAWGKRTKRAKKDIAKVLPKVKPGDIDARPVPDRVYLKALMRADERERLWLELAHDFGLRRTEVALVAREDVFEDLIGYSLRVHGKGGHERDVPLDHGMAARLLALPVGYAFPGDDNGHISPRWIGKRATLLLDGDWTLHKLRHAAGTGWYMHGDLALAQKLLGHKSPVTTLAYVKLPDERLRQTVLDAKAASSTSRRERRSYLSA